LRDRLLAYISNNERRQIQTELKRVDNQIESIQQKPAKTIISNSNPNPTQIINHVHNVHSN
jgi:peptidoglycan hydrolase CwlO-like protein